MFAIEVLVNVSFVSADEPAGEGNGNGLASISSIFLRMQRKERQAKKVRLFRRNGKRGLPKPHARRRRKLVGCFHL
jgi:hypothetical protein